MKAEGSILNTHIERVKGFVNYFDEKDELHSADVHVDIRCTSETDKETISLCAGNVLIGVKVKDVEKLIAEARADRKGNNESTTDN